MDFDADSLADVELIDIRLEGDNRAHIRGPAQFLLKVSQPKCLRGAGMNDLEVGRADRNRIDAHQNFGGVPARASAFRAA